MIYPIISGLCFGIIAILLKYFISFTFPNIFLNIFSYIVLIIAVTGFIIFQLGLKKNSLGITNAISTSVATVIPVMIAIMFFGETVDIIEIVGASLIILSIIVLVCKR